MRYFATIILLLASVAGSVTARAQGSNRWEVRPIDFQQIRSQTTDPQSRLYYPNILSKLAQNDTTMTYEGYRALYYGIAFSNRYNPGDEMLYDERLERLYRKENHSRQECQAIEDFAEKALEQNPFNLDQMSYLIYVLKEKRKWNRAAILQRHLDRLTAAILSSGKGTKENPWTVMYLENEYFIINTLGYVAIDQESLPGLDYIKVKKADGSRSEVQGFYFDVSRMLGKTR